ncbi:uncharacterized protein FOMMEDRAFT_161150 [Fomitiporia mediterranea MF3/22]|uniref:uncharacterized protein n=1 Tax=Fomitiporia mediterranea (strain MF3/22) TaxID=694068 RepID=UPI00044098D0|nr:uncharacterized protein FOMMEDRAFT_161150 [Fomitiporia mediterranea MF3/22]EJC98942.1 hypothetical protein FOMMEDRAFT_161150 [Fomitiporia mediterranea MF3/22]
MALLHRSNDQYIDPTNVAEWVSVGFGAQCVQVAVVTALVYDTSKHENKAFSNDLEVLMVVKVIRMDKEIQYFWVLPVKFVNIAYFLVCVAKFLIASKFAHLIKTLQESIPGNSNFSEWTSDIIDILTLVLIDYIMMVRVIALYSLSKRHATQCLATTNGLTVPSEDKKLAVFLKALLCIEVGLKTSIIVYLISYQDTTVFTLAEDAKVCGAARIPSWRLSMVDWVVQVAYGFLLMVLATYRTVEYWGTTRGYARFSLVKVIIRDQIIYFALVIIISVFNVVKLKIATSNFITSVVISCLGNPSFLCIIGSHILFNLREACDQRYDEDGSCLVKSRAEMTAMGTSGSGSLEGT